MHPQHLQQHSTSEYLHINMFDETSEFMFISSYYHDSSMQFPIGMHKHTFYEINIIVQGEGYHYMENRCFEAGLGSVYIIPPNINHGYWTEDDDSFRIFHILIGLGFMERYKRELASIPKYSTLFEIEPFLRAESKEPLFLILSEDQLSKLAPHFEELALTEQLPHNETNIIKIGKVLSLIGIFSQLLTAQHHKLAAKNSQNNTSSNSFMIIRTLEYMKENYSRKILIDDLAQLANMSRTTYLRQFKLLCKCSPYDYLTEIRVEQAAALLKFKDLSVTRISQDCGFFDSSHFSKVFKKLKKCSPLAYRKRST